MRSRARRTIVRGLLLLVGAGSLVVCLAASVFYILGRFDDRGYKTVLLAGTIVWFLCAGALTAAGGEIPNAGEK